MSRALTIVGASVRAAAQSALRAGFRVCAGDRFADADLCSICETTEVGDYPAGLIDVVMGPQTGPWMYTGACENHAGLVATLVRARQLLGNGAAVLQEVRNPQLVAESLSRGGRCVPEVAFAPQHVPRNGTWVVKPRKSAGGCRIDFWEESGARVPRSIDCYFQRFVDGRACSAVYVAARGRAVLVGITRQLIGQSWCGASGFRYCGSIGPIELPSAAIDNFARIGDLLAGRFNLVGLFGVDAIVNAAGVWPVEVNPRYTASMEVLERAGGPNAIRLHVAACEEGQLPNMLEQSCRVSGKAILFAPQRLTISQEWTAEALARQGWEQPPLGDIPRAGSVVESGGPIVTVFADADNEATVLELLRTRADSELTAILKPS
jgi:predicted ATP-grasp superfamily ATP-dependent carboligase